jgi:hypothetical protein
MSHFPKTEFGYVPSLALFEKPSIDSGIMGYKWVQYRPISQISNSGNLQFTISGTSDHYINLRDSYLQIKGQIYSLDTNQPITDADDVALENIPLQTIWSQIDISLQQKVINSRVDTNYAYKSYLDVLLKNSKIEMSNQLTSQLFFKDDATLFDSPANAGYRVRKKHTANGKEIQLEGPLYLDIAQQERPIINGVEINLNLWANKPTFYLSSLQGNYYFKINDAILNVCEVEVSPAILVGHAAALNQSPALYPYMQSDFKAFNIPKGQYEYSIDNVFQGDVPADVVVGLVSSRAYTGAYNKNPFNFHNFDCSYCGFFINGISTPSQPYQPLYFNPTRNQRNRRSTGNLPPSKRIGEETEDITEGLNTENIEGENAEEVQIDDPNTKTQNTLPPSQRPGVSIEVNTLPPSQRGVTLNRFDGNSAYVNSYLSLFSQKYHSSKNIAIGMEEYPYGYCLYRFQISENTTEDAEFVTVSRRGHTRLTLKFRKPLPESVTAIIYAHFPRILQIDESRNITA